MHDELIEHRLTAALREEADALPLTITGAELERRFALRRRTFAGRRLTLLLAAAVGLSLFGIGGALSGLFDQPKPQPTGPIVSTAPVAAKLPTLNKLVAVDPGSILVAQAHGPEDGPPAEDTRYEVPPASVVLGTFGGPTDYQVQVACLGEGTLELDLREPSSTGAATGPRIGCDGSVQLETVHVERTESIGFSMSDRASWRIVVRGAPPFAMVFTSARVFPLPPGQQELVRLDDLTVERVGEPWGISGLAIQEIGAVPPRERYSAAVWCRGASPIRYILGDTVNGVIVPDTETQVACQPGVAWEAGLGIAQPNSSRVFLAADPGGQVSFLLTSRAPPVALTQDLPGWRISGGLGPDFAFETTTHSLGGAGVGEDHVQVVLACTGTEPIDVEVADGTPIGKHTQKLEATCTQDGSTTSQIFKVAETGVGVSYVAPKGSWTAVSILVPDAAH
jgi:hypothetical protein